MSATKFLTAGMKAWTDAKILHGEWAICDCNEVCPCILYPRGSPMGENKCDHAGCNNTYEIMEGKHDEFVKEEAEKEKKIADEAKNKTASGGGSNFPKGYAIVGDGTISEAVVKVFNEFIVPTFQDQDCKPVWEKNKSVLGADPVEASKLFSAIYESDDKLKQKRLNAIRNTKSMRVKTGAEMLENLIEILDDSKTFE